MSTWKSCLQTAPTPQQEETAANYPTVALDYATARVQKRQQKVTFNYFMGIVRSFLSQNLTKKEQPPAKPQPVSYLRNLPEEDPLEAVIRICKNLTEDTIETDGYRITAEAKRRVAKHDPWFDKLNSLQKAQMLTTYPFYANIVGLGHQYEQWMILHKQSNLK